ncbi:insulin-like growth factor-binding complex acid labile [Brachionus plicatilis]|uniref:Insulin-like growth factor-binding complex acid labile n=1 Tax=Brachionus plicatilis TaxID=10195 RepID=A0A3M7SHK6_BRAPC|nr:insulin-like growth factor-binding complex acid labile [Brachionus plicatilis]
MILFLIASCLLAFVNADPRCPFPSCSRTYTSWDGKCSIECQTKTFPDIGTVNVDKIKNFFLYNLENIPKNAFQGLNIDRLIINSLNLTQVDEGAFDNVKSLERIELYGIKNLSILLENNRIGALFNVTRYFHTSNAGLNNISVVEILDKLKSWTQLYGLYISRNYFQHFSYNFNNFTVLSSLSLTNNNIESFDIKGNRLTGLSLSFNKISKLEKEMFVNLPNLSSLSMEFNNIQKIYNDSFESTMKLQSIYLGYNDINYIEPDSFCKLNFYSLKLSGNNLSDINLYCLENVSYLYLSSVQFKGEIDQKRLGNPKNVIILYLNSNKISKIKFDNMTSLNYLHLHYNELANFSSETIQAWSNLLTLQIEHNKFTENSLENFKLLKKLENLYLNNNLLTRIDSSHFVENKNLNRLEVQSNKIESVKFSFLKNLQTLYLNFNKLRIIDKESFSELPNLEHLHLDSNSIAKIHPKSFESNVRLSTLSLRYNHLTTTPDITKLKILNVLDLSNNKITSLPNHAFERRLDEANPLKSDIKVHLTGNDIKRFTSKTFCSQHASSLGFLGFQLLINDINKMDKCMLRQFNSDNTVINSRVKPSCDHLLMAEHENINLNGNVTACEHLSIDFGQECYSNSKYKCPKGDELVRHTTWLTGDPHLYSYKNKYELCSTGQDAVCFQYGDFELRCSDAGLGGSNQLATVLVNLKFIYRLSGSLNISFEANKTSFPNSFDNGLTTIYNNEKNPYFNDILVELINAQDGSKVIYIPRANTHIFISKWNSFYSITLRATHETYSESVGYLYEGCRLQDQMTPRIKRQVMEKQKLDCQAECSKIQFSTDEENMPEDVIRDACSFDCIEIGIDSITMIKSMVEQVDTLILSDVYTNLSFPDPGKDTSFSVSNGDTTETFLNEISTKPHIILNNTNVPTSNQFVSDQPTKEKTILSTINEKISTKDSLTSNHFVSDQPTKEKTILSTINEKISTKDSLTSNHFVSDQPTKEKTILSTINEKMSTKVSLTSNHFVSDQPTKEKTILSTINEKMSTKDSLTSISRTSSSEEPASKNTLLSSTTVADESGQFFSLKEYIAIGIAAKIRVSNKDETEMDDF